MRKQKEHQALLGKLGKGDEVITRGGIIGKITGISDDGVLVLELQEKVRVRVPRAYVEGKWDGKVPERRCQARCLISTFGLRSDFGSFEVVHGT